MRGLPWRTVAALLLAWSPAFAAGPASDAEVRQALIAQSAADFPSLCPCPYSTTPYGKLCGARSAYTRPRGQVPLCYDRDVTDEMIRAWRERNGR